MPRKLSKSNYTLGPTNNRRSSMSSQTTDTPILSPDIAVPSWLQDGLPVPHDVCVSTPIRAAPQSNHATFVDRNGESFSLYRDVPHILQLISSLPENPIRLAVASKSPVGDLCREALKLLRLPAAGGSGKGKKTIEVFDGGLEIYEGTKLRHFEVISRRTGVPFHEMLFFDDERPNREVEQLGVTMRLVENGLSWNELEKGVQQWRKKRGFA
ncbi:hypothetical protein OQA88_2378 [Cercophora sp. LCS_1]